MYITYFGASGIVDYVVDYLFDEDLLCVSEDGANLLARIYPIAFSISGKTWVNNHAHVLKFPDIITQKFVEVYINSIRIDDYVSGMAQPKLNQAMLNKIPIPLPPLAEQKRIVAILDKAFSAINKAKANAEKNLANAKELFESYLNGCFDRLSNSPDCIQVKLGEVCEFDKQQGYYDKPYVGLEDIEPNSGRFLGKIDNKKVKSSTFYFNNQHILFGRLRPYLNKVLVPDFEGHCSTEIFPIKVKINIDRHFLARWLMMESNISKINATCTGARMPRANMNVVLNFPIPLPPLAEQKRIVAKLDALKQETNRLEEMYRRKIQSLDELKKSILKKAFRGELGKEKGEV